MKEKKCISRKCRKPFAPMVAWQKFCSPKCRDWINNQKRAKEIKKLEKFYKKHALIESQGAA